MVHALGSLGVRIWRTDASLILNQLLRLLDLLFCSSNNECLPIIPLVAGILLYLNKCTRILLYQTNILSPFADDDAGPARWNWVFNAVLSLPEY